ncbi:hypothetical protein KAFR_0F03940 [Kazachstania africana CBS 2517]|uniref:C2H2-type domain-containing protein n=1 Tax=Kazachstania africana (strain ATCC 22294 / BCRC 22015 / CBS 2517 / CECT 1963 / NBRC 1671 / NRRL Y-8276) TaxID=1071382 RepID=H2AX90_KAZAF|nr:hypothetical protein KAFR_0F03940 [Kazachstania africana CBS 2517]CCF58990.1 hypothetical protein KAFR_0F03940 [Kazachstania africana CBS 2517]
MSQENNKQSYIFKDCTPLLKDSLTIQDSSSAYKQLEQVTQSFHCHNVKSSGLSNRLIAPESIDIFKANDAFEFSSYQPYNHPIDVFSDYVSTKSSRKRGKFQTQTFTITNAYNGRTQDVILKKPETENNSFNSNDVTNTDVEDVAEMERKQSDLFMGLMTDSYQQRSVANFNYVDESFEIKTPDETDFLFSPASSASSKSIVSSKFVPFESEAFVKLESPERNWISNGSLTTHDKLDDLSKQLQAEIRRLNSKKISEVSTNKIAKNKLITPPTTPSHMTLVEQLKSDKPLLQAISNTHKRGSYRCAHCPIMFSTVFEYASHLDKYEIRREFKCPFALCPWKILGLPRRSDLRRHCAIQHKHELPDDLKEYLNLKEGTYPSMDCPNKYCSRTFYRKDAYNRHVNVVHDNYDSRFNKRLQKLLQNCPTFESENTKIKYIRKMLNVKKKKKQQEV